MKALKTVAVALGITLGALIIIPLAVLAGLFVWLKLTEEADEELLELDRESALIDTDHPPTIGPELHRNRDARRPTGGRRSVRRERLGPPTARPTARCRPRVADRAVADRRLVELGVVAVMLVWPATSSWSRAPSGSCRRSRSPSCATCWPR
jgi:hypothetical protein